MGYSTVVLFRNDALADLDSAPIATMAKIIGAMSSAIDGPVEYAAGRHANALMVMPPCHSAERVLYTVQGGLLTESRGDPDRRDYGQLLADVLIQLPLGHAEQRKLHQEIMVLFDGAFR